MILALRRQRLADACEFKGSQVYIVSSRSDRLIFNDGDDKALFLMMMMIAIVAEVVVIK